MKAVFPEIPNIFLKKLYDFSRHSLKKVAIFPDNTYNTTYFQVIIKKAVKTGRRRAVVIVMELKIPKIRVALLPILPPTMQNTLEDHNYKFLKSQWYPTMQNQN